MGLTPATCTNVNVVNCAGRPCNAFVNPILPNTSSATYAISPECHLRRPVPPRLVYVLPRIRIETNVISGTSLARPVIARGMMKAAEKEGCDFVSHGCVSILLLSLTKLIWLTVSIDRKGVSSLLDSVAE